MFLGLHSFCHNNYTHLFRNKKNSKVLACKQCLGMFHCSRMKNGGDNIVPAHGVCVSMEDSRTEDWTLNLTSVAWVDFCK